jgi:microcystin-dependent protein
MKNKIFALSIFAFAFFNLSVNAQTTVTSSGISIQGIARDETNSALANLDQLNLVFSLYYLDIANSEQIILNKTANVTTDNFGVFSYVMVIDQLQYNLISTKETYLKVVQGSVVFSNEKLQTVPYAIHAQNGVPTGSIMPFIGTVAPNGWLLCDGSSFTDNAYTANLKALLGSTNTPNLQGLFLRGTGSAGTGKVGPDLKAIQQDDFKSHLHSDGTLATSTIGNHQHTTSISVVESSKGGDSGNARLTNSNLSAKAGYTSSASGEHNHDVTGSTAATGGTETRPINFGVNYIIKI